MKIEDYAFNGIVYKAHSPRKIRKMFRLWKRSLNKIEKKAFANYRKKLFNHNNINTQLRNKSMPCDAVTISNALKKAYLSEHLIVFRRLDKRENNIIGQVSVNHVFYCADFKGTHVGKKFLIFGKVDIICSY